MTDQSINTWTLHGTFVQANLVAGYRYLDLSGNVLNRLAPRYNRVDVVTPGGSHLIGQKDEADPYELTFGSDRIWLHYTGERTLTDVANTAPPLIRGIAEDIETLQINRMGLRTVYFVPSKDVLTAGERIASKVIGGPLAEFVTKSPREELRLIIDLPFIFDDVEATLRIRWITISRPPITPADYPGAGLTLDIDVGKRPTNEAFRRRDVQGLTSDLIRTSQKIFSKTGPELLEGVPL